MLCFFFFFSKTFIGNLTGKSSTRITNSCLKMKCHFRAVSTYVHCSYEDGTTTVSQMNSAPIKKN